MSQLGLFGMAPKAPPPPADDWFFEGWEDEIPSRPPPPNFMAPRWYQSDAIANAKERLREKRSTLTVMATGLGKTVFFGNFAHEWTHGPVLFLAHRDELVQQARTAIELITGEHVEVEQADLRASANARYVVGSIQSFNKRRLERMGRDRFSLVVVDEAHHYVAASFRRALDHFDAKLLGVTATPDRGDSRALGQLFDSVAYTMGIEEGIEHGYLVPLRAETVSVKSLDISGVETKAGDLVAGQLDTATLKAIEGIVKGILEHSEERRGPVFFAGVKSAEAACHRFNALVPGSAVFVSGETESEERRRIMHDVKANKYRFLCNCQIATEGFDWPSANFVGLGRPTKSRSLCAQMIGRGTRVLPGTIDHLSGRDDSSLRRAAVLASDKPDCLVLDFAGNVGTHSLATPEDVLGGNYTEAEVELAKKRRTEGGGDVRAQLQEARKILAERARKVASKVETEKKKVDLFSCLHMTEAAPVSGEQEAISQGQFDMLTEKFKVNPNEIQTLSKRDATRLIQSLQKRRSLGLATHPQLKILRKFGINEINIRVPHASQIIDYLLTEKRNGRTPDPVFVQQLLVKK